MTDGATSRVPGIFDERNLSPQVSSYTFPAHPKSSGVKSRVVHRFAPPRQRQALHIAAFGAAQGDDPLFRHVQRPRVDPFLVEDDKVVPVLRGANFFFSSMTCLMSVSGARRPPFARARRSCKRIHWSAPSFRTPWKRCRSGRSSSPGRLAYPGGGPRGPSKYRGSSGVRRVLVAHVHDSTMKVDPHVVVLRMHLMASTTISQSWSASWRSNLVRKLVRATSIKRPWPCRRA